MKTKNFLNILMLLGIFMLSAQELALVQQNDIYGFINSDGEMVIPAQFKNAKSFSNGLAGAEKDDKWGYIDSSGNWAIAPEYDKIKYYDSGYTLVLQNDQWAYIDKEGNTLSTPVTDKYYDFEDGVAIYRKEDKVGLINTKGEVVVEPMYEQIKKFRNNHAKVQKGTFWGMINNKGEVVIPIEYEEIGDTFNVNGVFVMKGGIFGIYHNGAFNAIEGADRVWDFPEGETLTYARIEKQIGFVNSKGEWVIKPQFDKARAFSNGLAPVYNNKKWGYINEKGELAIEYQFRDAETFASNGMAPVKDKKWGFIDKTGKLIIPMDYDISVKFGFLKGDEEKGFINGLARVKSKEGWGFLKKDGALLGNTWYQEAEPFVLVE